MSSPTTQEQIAFGVRHATGSSRCWHYTDPSQRQGFWDAWQTITARPDERPCPETTLGDDGRMIKALARILVFTVAAMWLALDRGKAEQAEPRALNNVQREMTTCAAFY